MLYENEPPTTDAEQHTEWERALREVEAHIEAEEVANLAQAPAPAEAHLALAPAPAQAPAPPAYRSLAACGSPVSAVSVAFRSLSAC